jgi:hypothetical protein
MLLARAHSLTWVIGSPILDQRQTLNRPGCIELVSGTWKYDHLYSAPGLRSGTVAARSAQSVPHSTTRWYRVCVADHYTLRLAPGVRQRLSEWARRAGIQERTLAQRYVDEGLRHDAHPLIQFLDGPSGRRASLLGRGLDVWEVIATIRDNNGSMTETAAYLRIPAGLVEAAAAYYGEYRDEIDREIELNEAEYERGRAAAAAGEQALRS